MRMFFSLILAFSFFFSVGKSTINEDFEKTLKSLPDNKEKVDMINDEVDRLLKPEPTAENCKKAKPLALQAAKIAEALNYKIGMLRSYEQLAIIYKTLDIQIQYLKYKTKAAMVDQGEELKKQEDKIHKQDEDLEKQKRDIENQKRAIQEKQREAERIKQEIALLAQDNNANKGLIEQKQKELAEKEEVLSETSGKLDYMTHEAERLATQNKLLEQEAKIKELEVERQRIQKYGLLSGLGILLLVALLLFNLYRTKHRTAKELAEMNKIILQEKKRSDELLLNILPVETANELKSTGKAVARDYEMVTVLFSDFKDFTKVSETMSPKDLVNVIDMCYSAFDGIMEKYGIEKIKTIGDAYLCADGIAQDLDTTLVHNPRNIIHAAFEIIEYMSNTYEIRKAEGKPFFRIRIGIHSGPLVAGVVGKKKFAYDIWGDTVNTAARMEQNSEPGRINVSSVTYEMVKDEFNFTYRGKIEAKNKGSIDMYFVDSEKKTV